MGKVKNGVPDRWYNYKSLGSVIKGTRIVAFKVPLQYAQIDDNTGEDYRLNVDKLIKELPNLGAVIDLTNTTRYYNPTELEKNGVIHEKIFVPGHVIPRNGLRSSFRSYVKSFLEENKDNDKVIGVHCTHGVNRTGFMICDYLVHELKMHPLEAIQLFEAARNHRIERENYRDFLISNKDIDPQDDEQGDQSKQSRLDDKREFTRKRSMDRGGSNDGEPSRKKPNLEWDQGYRRDDRDSWRNERFPGRREDVGDHRRIEGFSGRGRDDHFKQETSDRWNRHQPPRRDDMRQERSTGRRDYNDDRRRDDRRPQSEWRPNSRHFNKDERRGRSTSPEVNVPRIPRTPSPVGSRSAPRSKYCSQQGRGFYRMSIPQHRRIPRERPERETRDVRGNPFK